MGMLSLNELRAGMVLEAPLFNGDGLMLLPRGTRLEAKHLDRFRQWRIREAAIEGALTHEAAAHLDPSLLAAVERALDEKFALDDGGEIMAEVKRIVRTMTLQEAQHQKRHHE